MTLLPTERSVLRGLAVLRWGAWAWSALVVLVSADRVTRPWLAVTVLAAALLVCVAGTVSLAQSPGRLTSPQFVVTELIVGFMILAADPLIFESSANRQSLAGFWPVVGVLHAAVIVGPLAGGAIGILVSSGRLAGLLADGRTRFPASTLISLLATTVFLAVAGTVAGWVAQLLREAEHEVAATRAREEVARTLHDGVLQILAVVSRRTAASDPELASLARTTDRDLRAFLFGAQHPVHDDLARALRAAADRVASTYDLAVTVNVIDDEVDEVDVAAPVVQALCGAVGEALSNVGKHAATSKAVVFAQREPSGKVFVSVRDDGIGFDLDRGSRGEGLRHSIIGRIEELGGRVEVASAEGTGTEVRLWL